MSTQMSWTFDGQFQDISVAANGTLGVLTTAEAGRKLTAFSQQGFRSSVGISIKSGNLTNFDGGFALYEVENYYTSRGPGEGSDTGFNTYGEKISLDGSLISSTGRTFVAKTNIATLYPPASWTEGPAQVGYDDKYIVSNEIFYMRNYAPHNQTFYHTVDSDMKLLSTNQETAQGSGAIVEIKEVEKFATGFISVTSERGGNVIIKSVSAQSNNVTGIKSTSTYGSSYLDGEFADGASRDFFVYAADPSTGYLYRIERSISGVLGDPLPVNGLPPLDAGQIFDTIKLAACGRAPNGDALIFVAWSKSGEVGYSVVNIATNTVVTSGAVSDMIGTSNALALLDISEMPDGRIALAYRGELEALTKVVVVDARQAGANVKGTSGADYYAASNFADAIDGGASADTVTYLGLIATKSTIVDLLDAARNDGAAAGDKLVSIENLIGSVGNDRFFGTEEKNLLEGSAGNDILYGRGGADGLDGGEGDDLLEGGAADDRLDGGAGTDTASFAGASSGITVSLSLSTSQAVGGGLGSDLLLSIENLVGSEYADSLTGNSGVNRLDGRGGADTMVGGSGSDTYIVDNAGDKAVEANGAAGIDAVLASVSYSLGGSELENLTLTGTASINGIGNSVMNVITGNSGNNVLNGMAGADSMIGGAGSDTYYVDNVSDKAVEANGAVGTDLVYASVSFSLAASELENLTLTGTSNLSGIGNSIANVINGNSGANILNGMGGADTMIGGAGSDTFIVDNASDKAVEVAGGGVDTVQSSVTFRLGAEIENLVLTGNQIIDGFGNAGANTITGNVARNVLNGGGGTDRLIGGLGDDIYVTDGNDTIVEAADGGTDTVQSLVSITLGAHLENIILLNGAAALNGSGNDLANVITGNDADNELNGGAGADRLIGGTGNDTYIVDNAGDVTVESAGGGFDTVLTSVSWTASENIEDVFGEGDADLIIAGNSLNNALSGGGGADRLYGYGGNDLYLVDDSNDRAYETAGQGIDKVFALNDYTLVSGQEIEEVAAFFGDSTTKLKLTGNEFSNTIETDLGDNVLNGMAGKDTLTGFAGKDIFVFSTALGAGNVDRITDFSAVDDTIQLSKAVFAALSAGTLVASAFKDLSVTGAKVDGDDRIIYNKTTGALSYDADGSGTKAAVQFATIDTKVSLTNADFFVV